jgi:hypothetical protein
VRENIAETALRRLEEEICSEARRRSIKHAEGCGEFELEQVVSCGSGDRWWRTKLDFGRGEPFDVSCSDRVRSVAYISPPLWRGDCLPRIQPNRQAKKTTPHGGFAGRAEP